jgi:ABC-type Fe3+/spermidine/putrescine transport system ATPase subunit
MFDGTYSNKNKIIFANRPFIVKNDLSKINNVNTNIKFMVRPEDIKICHPEKGFIKTRVNQVLYKGQMYEIRCI